MNTLFLINTPVKINISERVKELKNILKRYSNMAIKMINREKEVLFFFALLNFLSKM